jgi:regulator of protease activity HflC (stomatin/prohibitin superfamily)
MSAMTKVQVAPMNGVAMTAFVACLAAGLITTLLMQTPWALVAGIVVGAYLLFAIKVIRQWEKVALLRLGKYVGLRGPGMVMIVPVLETLSTFIDQRIRVASVTAESTLTRDTVPVNVDAIVFWMVWNAEKAILEVEDFLEAVQRRPRYASRLAGTNWHR